MATQLTERRASPPAAPRRPNAGGTIYDVKLGHLLAALGRYRPVLAVVAVILVLAVILEGPAVVGQVDRFADSGRAAGAFGNAPATSPPTTVPAADTFSAPAPLGGAGETPPPRTTPTTTPAFTYTPPAPSSSSGGGSSSGSGSGRAAAAPLTIAASAWASQTAGTPVADAGVPADSLPVGTRLGRADKLSFIRLSGDEFSLTLFPVDDESGHRSPEEAVIQACQITEAGWEEADAMSFDDAPPYDAENCAAGIRNDDGSWTFNLLVYPQRDDDRGFALVPGPDAPLDFQVAFAR
jgi:hypothetical protein